LKPGTLRFSMSTTVTPQATEAMSEACRMQATEQGLTGVPVSKDFLDRFRSGSVLPKLPHKKEKQRRMRRLKQLRLCKRRSWFATQAQDTPGAKLNLDQKATIADTFTRYDLDHSGTLGSRELRDAIADLGFCPRTKEEKQQFAEILFKVDHEGDGELELEKFENFCAEAMQLFRDSLRVEGREQFMLHDVDHSGTLSFEEVETIFHDMSLNPRTEEERKLMFKLIGNSPGTTTTFDTTSTGQVQIKIQNVELTFADFEVLLHEMREGIERIRRRRLRDLMSTLSPNLCRVFANELRELKDKFDDMDVRRKGELCHTDTITHLANLGMRTTKEDERETIAAFFSEREDTPVTFAQFLGLLQRIRRVSMKSREEELWKVFQQTDSDRSGYLSLAECSRLLAQLGLSPRSRAQQRHIADLFDVADQDGSGELDFDEFSDLFQGVHELIQSQFRVNVLAIADELHISHAQVEEYRAAFDNLDIEDDGNLRIEEVRRLVDMVKVTISGDALNVIIAEVDTDKSGVIEFDEFLKLIALIEERKAQQYAQRHKSDMPCLESGDPAKP